MSRKSIIGSIAVILSLIISYFSTDILRWIPNISEHLPENLYFRVIILRTWDYLAMFIVALAFFPKKIGLLLGLKHSLTRSILFALIFCIPLITIFLIFFDLNSEIQFSNIFTTVITPAIYEEIAYRALVFGSLYFLFNWKFFPAVLINATIFGLAHLYQANDPLNALFIFLFTFIGSIWFSWIYMKWNKNLFLIIFLHLFMNLTFELFEGNSNAAGDMLSNIGRIATLLFSIVITLRFTGSNKISFNNFKNLQEGQ